MNKQEAEKYFANCEKIELCVLRNGDPFKFMEGNRPVNLPKIGEIEKSMERGEAMPPITVDRNSYFIIDGQHRYKAYLRRLAKGDEDAAIVVSFVNSINPLLDAIKFNSKQKNWSLENYIDAYVVEGKESYILLQKFIDKHPFFEKNVKAAIQLIIGKDGRDFAMDGTLRINETMIIEAEFILSELQMISQIIGSERVMKADIILNWVKARAILENTKDYTFAKYMGKIVNFIEPISRRRSEWIHEYLRHWS